MVGTGMIDIERYGYRRQSGAAARTVQILLQIIGSFDMYERFGLELREIIIRVNRLGVDLIM
jgi:hypothetical protein